jgi:hypothetical protein
MINLAERLRRERYAAFIHFVRLAFKLREKSLAENRRAEAFKKMVENISAAALILFRRKKIFREQDLVYRGRDLGNENFIIAVNVIIASAEK